MMAAMNVDRFKPESGDDYPSSPWNDGLYPQEHLTQCEDDDCERCDYLIHGGFWMACDECGHWGHQDTDGWVMAEGIPFCSVKCAEHRFGKGVKIQ